MPGLQVPAPQAGQELLPLEMRRAETAAAFYRARVLLPAA